MYTIFMVVTHARAVVVAEVKAHVGCMCTYSIYMYMICVGNSDGNVDGNSGVRTV